MWRVSTTKCKLFRAYFGPAISVFRDDSLGIVLAKAAKATAAGAVLAIV